MILSSEQSFFSGSLIFSDALYSLLALITELMMFRPLWQTGKERSHLFSGLHWHPPVNAGTNVWVITSSYGKNSVNILYSHCITPLSYTTNGKGSIRWLTITFCYLGESLNFPSKVFDFVWCIFFSKRCCTNRWAKHLMSFGCYFHSRSFKNFNCHLVKLWFNNEICFTCIWIVSHLLRPAVGRHCHYLPYGLIFPQPLESSANQTCFTLGLSDLRIEGVIARAYISIESGSPWVIPFDDSIFSPPVTNNLTGIW